MAAKPALPPVVAWSYSRYADYKLCPAKFMYKHLMRLPDPSGPAAARGTMVHTAAETYITAAKKPKLIPELVGVKPELDFLRGANAIVEQDWGFKNDWNWIGRAGWFGPGVWFRMKADVVAAYEDNTGLLGDWKTGKMYFSNEEQVELFAAVGFMRFPEWTSVDVRLWYTDAKPAENEIQRVYTAKEGEAIRKDWTKRAQPMFKDRKFPPTPNDKCRWCNFSKEKGGPCKF